MSKITILDGGMGHQLQQMGAPFASPNWSADALLKAPEYVTKAHQAFIGAGADVITTNAYAVVPFHIGVALFDSRGEELIDLAGKLAREAADQAGRDIQVAGCIPPFFGSYRADFFKLDDARKYWPLLWQAQEKYVDFFLAETLARIQEGVLAAEISAVYSKPLWLSVTPKDDFVDGKPVLRSLETLPELYDALNNAPTIKKPQAILVNCAQPEIMLSCVEELAALREKSEWDFQIGVYANKFQKLKDDHMAGRGQAMCRDDIGIQDYLTHAQQWVNAGATIIGGCCGIGPAYIKALSESSNPKTQQF